MEAAPVRDVHYYDGATMYNGKGKWRIDGDFYCSTSPAFRLGERCVQYRRAGGNKFETWRKGKLESEKPAAYFYLME